VLRWARCCCRGLAWAKGGGKTGDSEDGPPAVQLGNEKLFPTNVNWVANSLDGKQLWNGADRPSIYIDKQLRLKGYDGCNMFSVIAYPLRQQKLAIGRSRSAARPVTRTSSRRSAASSMRCAAPGNGTWKARTC